MRNKSIYNKLYTLLSLLGRGGAYICNRACRGFLYWASGGHLMGICFESCSDDSAAEPTLRMYLEVSRVASLHSGSLQSG